MQELERAGASDVYISRFKDLGLLDVQVAGETHAHTPAKSVIGTHLKRLDEAIGALKI